MKDDGYALPPSDTIAAAIAIGPKNAEALTGHSYRWWRDHAPALGLQVIRIAGKSMIPADQIARVLAQRAAEQQRAAPALTEEQMTDQMLRELGFVPVTRG